MDNSNDNLSSKDKVEEAIVHLILAVRVEYLQAGASALRHWDQLQSRLRAAAATTDSVGSFVTAFCRGLQLEAPGAAAASAMQQLSAAAEEFPAWLELVADEYAFLVAAARVRADARREHKQAAAEEATQDIPF